MEDEGRDKDQSSVHYEVTELGPRAASSSPDKKEYKVHAAVD